MRNKIKKIIKNLNKNLINRDEEIKLCLLAVLAQEKILLFGPEGTGKTEILERISKVIGEDDLECLTKISNHQTGSLVEPIPYAEYLIKKEVNYLEDSQIKKLFDISFNNELEIEYELKITKDEIQDISNNLDNISIPREIREIIKKIRLDFKSEFEENSKEVISDKNLVKMIKIMKSSAYTNEREKVNISDVILLKNCMWNNIENRNTVQKIINENIEENYGNFDYKGTGIQKDPFLIETETDLININKEKYINKGYYFKQTKDILINSEWKSIGNEKKIFKGNYDGDNKKIKNLNNPLIYEIESSIIKNIILEDVKIKRNKETTGSIANISTNSYIENCRISGEISSKSASIGGIIGAFRSGGLYNCDIDIDVSGSSSCIVGGIIGIGTNITIEDCRVKGSVYCNTSSNAGGIIGYIGESDNNNINYSNFTGSVISNSFFNAYSGGVVGSIYYKSQCNICNCNVDARIVANSSSDSTTYASGIVTSLPKGRIEKCTFIGELSAKNGYGISKNLKDSEENYIGKNVTINQISIEEIDKNEVFAKISSKSFFDEKFFEDLGWNIEKSISIDEIKNKIEKKLSKKISLSKILKKNIWI